MFKAFIFTGGARLYSAAIMLAALVLTARWLGPEGRGVVVVLTTWVTVFATVSYLSLGQVCIYRAANDQGMSWLGEALGSLLLVTAAMTAVGWIGVTFLWYFYGEDLFASLSVVHILLAFAALPFLIWENYNSALLTIVGRVQLYNAAQFAGRTLTLVLLVILIYLLEWSIQGYLIAFLLGQAVVALAGITMLLRQAEVVRTSLGAVGRLVGDGAKLHLNAIGVILFSGVDLLMLQYFRGPVEAGLFQFAHQISIGLMVLPQAMLLLLNGKVRTMTRTQFWSLHQRAMLLMLLGLAAAAAILAACADWLVVLLAGGDFAPSGRLLAILCLAVVPAAFSMLMGLQWITRGLFVETSVLTIATGLGNIGLNLFLIPRYGAEGAAWAIVLSYCAIPLVTNILFALRINAAPEATVRFSRRAEAAEVRHP